MLNNVLMLKPDPCNVEKLSITFFGDKMAESNPLECPSVLNATMFSQQINKILIC